MPSDAQSFVDTLLDWHRVSGRHHLPWREPDRSPFELLIAEMLLQRTTAAAVSGAYTPFVARYPTPAAVAGSGSDAIERRVEPLGLSKRAAYIERCSGQLLAQHSGAVPRLRPALLELHGVGEYTARSLQVHAFGAGISAVDTNVRRLLSRFFDLDPDSDAIPSLADAIVPPERSSDFLYAMLDFAAGVCTPHAPDCIDCPLEGDCDRNGVAGAD